MIRGLLRFARHHVAAKRYLTRNPTSPVLAMLSGHVHPDLPERYCNLPVTTTNHPGFLCWTGERHLATVAYIDIYQNRATDHSGYIPVENEEAGILGREQRCSARRKAQ